MLHRIALLGALLIPTFFLPIFAHAQKANIPAGFVPTSVWLSRTELVSGADVRLYTVVYNSSQNALEGSVSFLIDGAEVGTAPFSLPTGDSKILSTAWTPSEGIHSVSAKISSSLDSKTKETRTLSSSTSASLSVTVAPPPPKPVALQTVDTASDMVASSTPVIASAVAQVTSATEALRAAGESYLTALSTPPTTTTTTDTPSRTGSVLGSETAVPDTLETPKKTLTQTIAGFLLPIFATPALFYLVFIGIFLFLFFLLMQRLRNPRRR